MTTVSAAERAKRLALFVMLVLGTLLHGISMAHVYLPALARAGACIAGMLK